MIFSRDLVHIHDVVRVSVYDLVRDLVAVIFPVILLL